MLETLKSAFILLCCGPEHISCHFFSPFSTSLLQTLLFCFHISLFRLFVAFSGSSLCVWFTFLSMLWEKKQPVMTKSQVRRKLVKTFFSHISRLSRAHERAFVAYSKLFIWFCRRFMWHRWKFFFFLSHSTNSETVKSQAWKCHMATLNKFLRFFLVNFSLRKFKNEHKDRVQPSLPVCACWERKREKLEDSQLNAEMTWKCAQVAVRNVLARILHCYHVESFHN